MDLFHEREQSENAPVEFPTSLNVSCDTPSSTISTENYQNSEQVPETEQEVLVEPNLLSMSQLECAVGPRVLTVTRPTRENVLQRLSEALLRRSLTKIDLSQRGLMPCDARLVKMALLQNSRLTSLKLGYNNLGDEGVSILSAGIAKHHNLQSLDLGFNNIGDEGCQTLCSSIPPQGQLQTLYVAGNLIGEDGAIAIADLIRRGSSLRRLYLTGNLLGAEGVRAISEAILEDERRRNNGDVNNNIYDHILPDDLSEEKQMSNESNYFVNNDSGSVSSFIPSKSLGMEQLYLGGAGIGPTGCVAISFLVRGTMRLRVLSLPNCDIGDDSVAALASSIKANRDRIPLESLQLSFNKITCRGMESLSNAVWGSRTLKELLLDNNQIADRGAQQIAAVLPHVKTMEVLNVGFNQIKIAGIKLLMKAVVDSTSITSISVSGNSVDTSAAKAIAYALAYNTSLVSLSVVHCSIGNDGQRHITAGIVSNSKTALRDFSGFKIGPVAVTLGFPAALEHWNNVQILNFIHLMWNRNSSLMNASNTHSKEEEEKMMDPLSFLSDAVNKKAAPLEATIVVDIAKKAYAALVAEGYDVFSRRPDTIDASSSPLVCDGIMVESYTISSSLLEHSTQEYYYPPAYTESMPNQKTKSFVASPEVPNQRLPDPSRKKRIVEWLCSNIQHINKLAQLPFNSAELWKLHQHYFTPVVNECGGDVSSSPNDTHAASLSMLSDPEVAARECSGMNSVVMNSGGDVQSQPSMSASSGNQILSVPMLKRKVSYRFLGDSVCAISTPLMDPRRTYTLAPNHNHLSVMIEGGPAMPSMPPTTKRARRNRSRISFLPRVKAKLDSYLDVCHEKALITMRQLHFVEQAILSGQVNQINQATTSRRHLCGVLASDAETIVVDMI